MTHKRHLVMIVEDQQMVLEQLKKQIRESVGRDADIEEAGAMRPCLDTLDSIWNRGYSQIVAVVDLMLPYTEGANTELAEPVVRALSTKVRPSPLLILVSAYGEDSNVKDLRSRYTAAPDTASSFFVDKLDIDWGRTVVKMIRRHIYSPEIEYLLDAVIGEEHPAYSPTLRIGKFRFDESTHQLERLTALIKRHYLDVSQALQERILKSFDVEVIEHHGKVQKILAGLR